MKKTLWLTILFALVLALPALAQNTAVYIEQGGAKLVIGSGGTLEMAEGSTLTGAETVTYTMGADEYVRIDAATTAQTQTGGSLDINFGSVTANASAFNTNAAMNNGTSSGANIYSWVLDLVANDADGDLFGPTITGTATTNAAAGSYEYLLSLDCAENTAGACPDGLLITSTGANTGVTDAIDVSAANITNGVNLGANILLMAAGDIDADSLTVDTTDDMTLKVTSGSAAEDLKIWQSGANDSSLLLVAEGTGTDALALTASAGTIDVDGAKVTVDTTDDLTVTVVSGSAGEDLTIQQTGANDSSIIISAAGTGADALTLSAAAGTVDFNGDVFDVDATGDFDITVTSSGGGEDVLINQVGANDSSITLTAAGTGLDAIGLQATAGGLDVDAYNDIDIQVTSGSAGEDILISQSGANDSSIVITAAGTGTDAIALQATAGTIDVDGNYVNIDSTEDMHFQVTSSQAGEDLYIAQVGGNDSSVLISAAGTGSDAVQLMASAGSVDIQSSLDVTVTPGDDLDLWGNNGTAAAAGNVDSYRCMGGYCQTVMTLTDVAVNILNTTGPGHNCFGGVKIYDFPVGWMNRLGVVATFTSITFGAGGLADASDGDVSFGSTTAVEDGGLAGTEADWVPTTELTVSVGGVVPAELATSTVTEQTLCDGSSAACDLYMNFEFDDADCSAADTLAVVGTVTVTWLDLGDN